MREHKYRAWDTVKKVMYSPDELGADQETLSADGRGFVNVSGISTRLSEFHTHLLPLDYIGLEDKNSKEIYEGDIVRFVTDREELLEIYWYEGTCGWQMKRIIGSGTMFIPNYIEYLEVIDNIYENSELIK